MSYFKNYFFLFLILGFNCCENIEKEANVPANILDKTVFTKVLTDFALAESAGNLNIKNVPQIKTDSTYAFNPLKENGVRASQFDSSLIYYCKHGKLYKEIYEAVLANLKVLETKKVSKVDSITLK